jgi:hypothetical protein
MNTGTKYLLLATGLAAFVLLGMAQAIFGPVLPSYAKTFGLDVSSVGWLLSESVGSHCKMQNACESAVFKGRISSKEDLQAKAPQCRSFN